MKLPGYIAHPQDLTGNKPNAWRRGVSSLQALLYRLSLPRVLATRALGQRLPWLIYGPTGPLRLEELPDPALPDDKDWALVRPQLAGICGTDIAAISGLASPSASPFNSFPAVLGHEILGVVEQAGVNIDTPVGSRVVIDPWISCYMRSLPPCRHCAAGRPYICENAAEGSLAPGMLLGFCRDLVGGWSQKMIVHKTQLFPVPDNINDEVAVLVEPISIGMHAVLRNPPQTGDRLLVIGAGSIGLCLLAALQLLNLDSIDVTVVAKHPIQVQLAKALGATRVVSPADTTALAQQMGAKSYRPLIGRAVFRGGFDIVYDCVGSRRSLDDALRLAREGGNVVVVGGAGEISRLDWTFVWMRELNVIGAVGSGIEHWQGRQFHTFELVLEGLQRRPDLPLSSLITHRFRLKEYRQALRAALSRRDSGAVKIVFTPNA